MNEIRVLGVMFWRPSSRMRLRYSITALRTILRRDSSRLLCLRLLLLAAAVVHAQLLLAFAHAERYHEQGDEVGFHASPYGSALQMDSRLAPAADAVITAA